METYFGRMNCLPVPWWTLGLKGLGALLFALVTFAAPGLSLVLVVAMFGTFAFFDGMISLIAAWRMRRGDEGRWALWLIAMSGIAAGTLAFVYPAITAVTLVYLIAFWAISSGVFHIASAVRFRKQITGEWLLGLTGLVQTIFGALLLIDPTAGALAVLLWLGAFASVFGVLLFVAAVRLRALQHRADSNLLRHA